MKKTICLFTASLMIFLLCSCNQKHSSSNEDEIETISQVQEVINLIDELYSYSSYLESYTFEYSDKDTEKAKNAYNSLSDEDKKMVTNYNKLVKAEILLIEDKITTDLESRATYSIESDLKNPSSLQINSQFVSLYYTSDIYQPVLAKVTTDYSAQNGFGGYNRATAYTCYMYNDDSGKWNWFSDNPIDFYEKQKEMGATLGSPYLNDSSNG